LASLGWLSGSAPSQLLHSSLAQHEKLEKAFDLLATTKNISVINILLLLNPKHSSYWEENELYPRQNQNIRTVYQRNSHNFLYISLPLAVCFNLVLSVGLLHPVPIILVI